MRPWAMSFPWSEVGPVRSTRLPSLMVSWAWAGAVARTAARRPNRANTIRMARGPFIRASLSRGRTLGHLRDTSVRVGPQGPVALDARPDARQPLGLVHQEEDHGEPEDDVAGRGDEPEGLRVHAGER